MSELAPDDQSVKTDEQQGGDVDASGVCGALGPKQQMLLTALVNDANVQAAAPWIPHSITYVPHPAQVAIHRAQNKRFRIVCTGRRFGKRRAAFGRVLRSFHREGREGSRR